MDVKKWVGNGAPQYAQGFQQDFNTHYVDPQEGYKRITDLAALNPDIAQIYDLPNKTAGYQRLAQTVVGMTTRLHRLHLGSERDHLARGGQGGRRHVQDDGARTAATTSPSGSSTRARVSRTSSSASTPRRR